PSLVPDAVHYTMRGRLESTNISRGGVPKLPLFEALVTEEGLDGDVQRDRRHHGGPDRAVVIFSLDVIRQLQEEGHPVAAGTIGENLTVSGRDWSRVVPGTVLHIGEVRLEVSKYASPCEKIAGSFLRGEFMRVSQREHAGWSRVCARVLSGGLLQLGEPVAIR